MEFNDNQKDVIKEGKGLLLVEAGPGSGKTTVIIERVKCLIKQGVPPESFLIITFTVKAAENLKTKFKKHIPKEILAKMKISTIHSFCLDFLKTKNQNLILIEDDNKEKRNLFIKKYKNRLGFKGISTLKDYQIPAVIDKFEEYTKFKVDKEGLIDYIKENKPINSEYLDFMKPLQYVSRRKIYDEGFKKDWYNARFLQVPKAYEEYLNLLEEKSLVDYNTLQKNTLKELEKDSKTQYTTVFVDEFQDTDPLQFKIFKKLLENAEYFTAVGDVDQRIYSFRSTFNDYFEEFVEEYPEAKLISLDENFRSTDNIVKLTDKFIKHQRSINSKKQLIAHNQDYDNDSFILKNETSEDEANRIFEIIMSLKNKKLIESYDEVALLYRKHNTKTISLLIDLFKENNIPFSIKGQSDLYDKNEIKSFIILLWYITRKLDDSYITSKEEYNWLNLRGFTLVEYENIFWSLKNKTKQYLIEIQESFENQVREVRNDVRDSEGRGKVTSLNTIKDEPEKTLIKMFKKIEKPVVDITKIEDESDKQFFIKLEELRENKDLKTILEIYYELLSLSNYFEDMNKNINEIKNLSILTKTIYNYESIISRVDITGLYFFLTRVIKDYDSFYSTDGGVQLMTIHSAKGLEFPVVIIPSLQENSFPSPVKDPERKNDYLFGKETFYTPNQLLEYKNVSIEEENIQNDEEEERVIYVAMTRAVDLLILSCVGNIPKEIEKISPLLKEIDLETVEINNHDVDNDEEELKLNYSKYSAYQLCPYRFNLSYILDFKVSDQEKTNLGTVFHNVMDRVNQKLKKGLEVSGDEIKDITKKVFESKFSLKDDKEEFNEVYENILSYRDNFSNSFDVLDSEVPFEVDRGNYTLNGAIDLIYRISDTEIGILDYKHSEAEPHKKERYKEQLFIYASALKEVPGFDKYTIKEAKIYFAISKIEYTFEIKDELLQEQMEKLDNVAEMIINEEFNEKHTSNYCDYCEFRLICS